MVERFQAEVEMLHRIDPEIPFVADLELELERLRAERGSSLSEPSDRRRPLD